MRKKLLDQLPLTPAPIDHIRATELSVVSNLLDVLPAAAALVHEDLSWRKGHRVDVTKGRNGMLAEQVLRVAILKQHTGLSYDALAFSLSDSSTYRRFCRMGFSAQPPKKSTLQKNIKQISSTTWAKINTLLIKKAQELGVDNGERIRTDCTVVQSNIHHPTDSTLLGDCVVALMRLMKSAKKVFGIKFKNNRRLAKRRVLAISNAKSTKERTLLYRELLRATESALQEAERVEKQLHSHKCPTEKRAKSSAIFAKLQQLRPMVGQIISQTERRILRGEKVPAEEKIVSIHEEHTDIILKGGRDVEYGHKVCLTTGNSSLVTDVVVESGNPSDKTMAVRAVEHHKESFGAPPKQVCFDGGFASQENIAMIKALGVEDVVFHKRCGIAIEDMTKSKKSYKRLRAFRAGIEGTISFLKRSFGLKRCTWRNWESFQSYVYVSVSACNLLVIARHLIAARS